MPVAHRKKPRSPYRGLWAFSRWSANALSTDGSVSGWNGCPQTEHRLNGLSSTKYAPECFTCRWMAKALSNHFRMSAVDLTTPGSPLGMSAPQEQTADTGTPFLSQTILRAGLLPMPESLRPPRWSATVCGFQAAPLPARGYWCRLVLCRR